MDKALIIITCVILLCISGCTTQSRSLIANDICCARTSTQQEQDEIITYYWNCGINVAFTKSADESHWATMTISDSCSIYDQCKESEKIWNVSTSKCSKEECLRIIDRSVTMFYTEKPEAHLEMVAIEMHVIRDLWGEVLAGLQHTLGTLDGTMGATIHDAERGNMRADYPYDVADTIEKVLCKSPTTLAIKRVLRKHGFRVPSVGVANELEFKESCAGQKWSHIARLPGVGVSLPGVCEYDLESNHIRPTQHCESN